MASAGEQSCGNVSQDLASEDPGGGDWVPMDHIMSAIRELQSLVEWTSQRKGAKEESTVVKQKLQQLDKIRKELSKSANASGCFQNQAVASAEGLHSLAQAGDCAKQMDVDSSVWSEVRQECSDKITQSDRILQERQSPLEEQSPPRDRSVKFCATAEELSSKSPLPDKQETCDFPTSEKDLGLYIDFVSAKEQIQQLTMNLETEQSVKGTKKGGRHSEEIDEPDSLGTVISEDEGLGEESRRADSMGSNSFLDMQVSEEDLADSVANTSSVRETEENVSSEKSDSVWITDPQDPRISLELCRCTIYKLKENLRSKEDQLRQFAAYRDSANEVINLQDLVSELENEIKELKLNLEASESKNATLQEQVLELEEAENDSRRQCQRLEENLIFLQEKDSHFQVELAETKHAVELCVERLAVKEMGQKELYSQMKYMEVLIQKYEDQIRDLETSESEMKEKISEYEQIEFLKSQEEPPCDKGTQTYPIKSVHAEAKSCSRHSIPQTQSLPTSTKYCDDTSVDSCSKIEGTHSENSSPDCFNESNSSTKSSIEVGIQADLILESSNIPKDNSTQTEQEAPTDTNTNLILGKEQLPVWFRNQSDFTNISSNAILSSPCPFQKELFHRLHHLVEEDANLQQQLHHMDQINLTLWEKLHNLESNIGECKKENFQHIQCSEDESKLTDTVVTPVPREFADDISSQRFSPSVVNAKVLDAGEEEHFVSDGKSVSFDCNEAELRERLCQLDEINSSFEAELALREKLHSERELKHTEWVESENRFINDLRNLEKAKNLLLAKVAHLETALHQLEDKLKKTENELICTQERHRDQISLMTAEHEALTVELNERIDALALKEKEYLGQITSLRLEKKSLLRNDLATGELEKLKMSYVQLQIELNHNRNSMMQMENDFENQLEDLKSQYLFEEKRLGDEIRRLKEKQNDCNEQISAYQKKQQEFEATVSAKEEELENARMQFREHMLMMEDEHKSVEIELNKKLRQMEESTAFATRALTAEKIRLEKDLQENIYDLRSKEELYKARIAELEANVTQLHEELRRLTGDLDSGLAQYQGSEFPQFQRERLQKQLQELQSREEELREKLEEMEQKEAAYRETLENADRIVASVERGYKNKIEELEMSERSLKQRVTQLEEEENRLRVALHRERRSSDGRKPDDLVVELLEAEVRENALKEQVEFLEQSQRTASQKLKELERMREKLEAQLCDQEELMASLKRLQQEQESSRKDISNLRKSEKELREGLQQAEALIRNKDTDMQTEMTRMQEEKRDLEETIHQLRMQVRQLQSIVDCEQEEEGSGETLGESVAQSPEPVKSIPDSQRGEVARSEEVVAACGDIQILSSTSTSSPEENDVIENTAPLAEEEEVLVEESIDNNATIQKLEVETLPTKDVYRFIDDTSSPPDSAMTQDSVTPEYKTSSKKQDIGHEDQIKSYKERQMSSFDLGEGIEVFQAVQLKKQELPLLEVGPHKSVSILQVIQNLKKEKGDFQEAEGKVKDLQGNVNEDHLIKEILKEFPGVEDLVEKQVTTHPSQINDSTENAVRSQFSNIENTTEKQERPQHSDIKNTIEKLTTPPHVESSAENLVIPPHVGNSAENLVTHTHIESSAEKQVTPPHIENSAENLMISPHVESSAKNLVTPPQIESSAENLVTLPTESNAKKQSDVVPLPVTEALERKDLRIPDKDNKSSKKDLESSQCGDECSKARMQLEECMIRAMVAMEFDMRQKKVSQRMKENAGKESSSATARDSDTFLGQQKESSTGVSEPVQSSHENKIVESPFNFRIVQQVGSDTLLVGWEHAHPADLEGFEVYVDGALHETVYTPDRTKAVVSGVDLRKPLTLSVCAVSGSGGVSDPQVLHLPQHSPFSNDGFFFLDDEDDDDDVVLFDDEPEKQTRPYSTEW